MENELICQDCGKKSKEVTKTICPYASEINDKEVEIIVCAECYLERFMDT